MNLLVAIAALIVLLLSSPAIAGIKQPPDLPKIWGYVARPDGSIGVYRLDTRTGELRAVPKNTVPAQRFPTGVSYPASSTSRLLELVASPTGRYLYAFVPFPPRDDFSDHSESADENAHRPVRQVRVYRINPPSGALRLVQTAQVPAPIMQLVPHPGGRLLCGLAHEGILCVLKTRPDGTLVAGKQVRVGDAPGVLNHWYTDGAWQILFAPNGKTLYTVGAAFSTEFKQDSLTQGMCLLQDAGDEQKQWRVGADGDLKQIGDTWRLEVAYPMRLDESPASVQEDPKIIIRVVSPKGDAIVARGGSGTVWMCRTDPQTGQILPPGKPFHTPKIVGDNRNEPRFCANPRYPFVYVGKENEPTLRYEVYQWTAGELRKTGDFAPLLPPKRNNTLFAEPTGRFLIEWGTTAVAAHRANECGDVIPARAAKPLPNETGSAILFVAPPPP